MQWIQALFLVRGRITRSTWLTRTIFLAIACAAGGKLASDLLGDDASAVFSGLFLVGALALAGQRLHDIGRSAWALWVLAIPVLGPLWMMFQLLRLGAVGSNRYGSDPAVRSGYLTVDIGQ